MDRDGTGLDGQRRAVVVAGPAGEAFCEHRLDDSNEAEDQGDQQQACFKVAAQCGGDERDADEDEPTEDPEQAPYEQSDEHDADGPVVAHQQQAGSYADEQRSRQAEELNRPASAQREESRDEFKEQVRRDQNQLQKQCCIPKLIEPGRAAGQIDKADGRPDQFIERQPEVFNVALLREVKREQKERKNQDDDGVDQPREMLEEAVIAPQGQ